MKRFFFWLALTFLGVVFLLRFVYQLRMDDSRPATVATMEEVREPNGRTRTVFLDRDAKVEVVNQDDDEFSNGGVFYGDDRVVREPAEGLPVPVVPGSRTTEARAEPPSPSRLDPPARTSPRRPRARIHPVTEPSAPARADDLLSVTGRLSATEERARRDARAKLEDLLAERLAPDVPRSWKAPSELIDGMIRQSLVVPRQRDYGTVYEATLKVDVSPARRAEIVAAYHRQEVVKRLLVLGAVLAFVLVCLAAVSGYIRADEATKGYYTTRLRLAAAAGVGAAGLVVYHWLT